MESAGQDNEFHVTSDPWQRHDKIYQAFLDALRDGNNSTDDITPYADRVNRSIAILYAKGLIDSEDAWVGGVGSNPYLPTELKQGDFGNIEPEFVIASLRSLGPIA